LVSCCQTTLAEQAIKPTLPSAKEIKTICLSAACSVSGQAAFLRHKYIACLPFFHRQTDAILWNEIIDNYKFVPDLEYLIDSWHIVLYNENTSFGRRLYW